ncbi:MAG: hypothetical protein LBH18_03970 [Spirochaetaceae bacterium]|jgi:hypothetical protein|nr:hypothetical protein [Spirochaetaceae bacterium]
MADNEFLERLKSALDARKDWFDNSELLKLKEEFTTFHANVSTLYDLFAKRGFIAEDIYKEETKVTELTIPPSGPFSENNKRGQLGQRIAALDNSLDFLINFHGLTVSSLTQDKIKTIIGIVKYIDWLHLTPDGINITTQAVSEVVSNIRHGNLDPITSKVLTDSLAAISGSTKVIINTLKLLNDFNRESYKYDVRINITASMKDSEANLENISEKFNKLMTDKILYPDLINEIIREDYSADSLSMQDAAIQRLTVEMGKPDKTTKADSPSFKKGLLSGLNILSSAVSNLSEIYEKIKKNHDLLEDQKNNLWEFLKKIVAQIINSDMGQAVYEVESINPKNGKTVREKLNFSGFCTMLEKRMAILSSFSQTGAAAKKLADMEEDSLAELLRRNIKEVQNIHKLLDSLDNYFKKMTEKSTRARLKGIKPELSALKNAITKASEKLQDYTIGKEEEEQFKKLENGD